MSDMICCLPFSSKFLLIPWVLFTLTFWMFDLSVCHEINVLAMSKIWMDACQLLHVLAVYDVLTFVFTALHVMQTRYCEEISVRLSVTRVIPDKTKERSVQIFIPYERTFSLVFWEEEWLVGGDPFYLKFWVNRPPLEKNRRFSTDNRS